MNRTKGKRKGIILYYSMTPVFYQLENEELGKLMKALLSYSEEGVLPKALSPGTNMLFAVLKQFDDKDRERFEDISEKRREAALKSEKIRRGEIPSAGQIA